MTWAQGKTLHTTRTGRAKPNGKVRRSSASVRKTKYVKRQDKPLPFDLQCHPQVLERTPRHPSCITQHIGFDVARFKDLNSLNFLEGVGLVRTTRDILDDWMLVRWKPTGEPLGFAPSHVALSYCRAAAAVGVELNAYREV